MDNNVKWVNEQRILRTIEALKSNNMNGYLVSNKAELLAKIEELVKEGSTVSCGGSVSLAESGVLDYLRSGKYNFLDRGKEGLTQEEIGKIYRGAFSADAYFTSSNAITEAGELYNVDGNGNRVAAMIFGPERVIVIVGVNKLVKDVDEAINRVKYVAAPANGVRLNRQTPCAKVGYCMDCKSKTRMCRQYTLIKSQSNPDRMHVIFINEELGY
ncbi:lactate utilization protein [Clostridium septicum]|uniref:Lactate utilization protein n=1 Tax=Clostridium septicum TaxID=1504 RepID=A0A9N7JLQ4_CLOSE|nr:lactate utilization protein [Clostridium septicum]AYE34284.1 lactate utilization protein [Clostridium septicum]MDU1313309.1 lactate utilization protein [Clostridium septicum]QAS59678.1 lactate utilization protein [Clostridium septicum]UEC21078.1 lactate utilization protein [Clostridium septicum]USS00873.1 lactate utilization protein [Clostridium septicum]